MKQIKELINFANHLDSKGLTKEANYLDSLIKSAQAGGIDERMDDAQRARRSSQPEEGQQEDGRRGGIGRRMRDFLGGRNAETLAEMIVADWTPGELAEVAESLSAQKIADIAMHQSFPADKRRAVIRLLLQNQEMMEEATTIVFNDPNLRQQAMSAGMQEVAGDPMQALQSLFGTPQ